MYFGAPIVYSVCRRWPRFRKTSVIAGFVVIIASLIGASFATTPFQLLATQGILYGIGGAAHYFPAFLYLDEWFFARRGTAYGIVWAGGGAAGLALPLTMQWILSEYGFRTALRVWAVTSIILATPAMVFPQRSTTHPSRLHRPSKSGDRFSQRPSFLDLPFWQHHSRIRLLSTDLLYALLRTRCRTQTHRRHHRRFPDKCLYYAGLGHCRMVRRPLSRHHRRKHLYPRHLNLHLPLLGFRNLRTHVIHLCHLIRHFRRRLCIHMGRRHCPLETQLPKCRDWNGGYAFCG